MVLVALWDGLRPDLISREVTPFLWQKTNEGVFGRANHAVFPSATRLSSASLATGCYPGRHGIVGNSLYIPTVDPRAPHKCSDWQFLQSIAVREGGSLLDAPTSAEIAVNAGKRVVFCGSGSSGTSFLSNPKQTTPIVNWGHAWPGAAFDEIRHRWGGFLTEDTSVLERSQFVLDVAKDYLIPNYRPDLMTVWLAEPDSTQHASGLGSPAHLEVLSRLDGLFGEFWDHLRTTAGGDPLTCLFLSDHGFSTISQTVEAAERLVSAGLKDDLDSTDVIVSSGNIHLTTESARSRIPDILSFLAGEPWIGGLFLREDVSSESGVPSQKIVRCGSHRRSSEITFTYRWDDSPNDHGVPGRAASSSPRAAGHGTASPYDLNNSFAAWGDGIKTSRSSAVPMGIVDIAPTVLHLLGLSSDTAASDGADGHPFDMDGRILFEILEAGPDPDSEDVRTSSVPHLIDGRARQTEVFSEVFGRRYLDRVDYGLD